MALERTAPQASATEVLDRVLDRGIVIDAWLRVSVAGIALIDVDARIVVASIDTYVKQATALAPTATVASPPPSRPWPAARTARTPRVQLQCPAGCTVLRAARRPPKTVRCPVDRRQSCPVIVLAPVA